LAFFGREALKFFVALFEALPLLWRVMYRVRDNKCNQCYMTLAFLLYEWSRRD
jgi:hypothetical protein